MTSLDSKDSSLLANIKDRIFNDTTYPRTLSKIRFGNIDLSEFQTFIKFENGNALIECFVPFQYNDLVDPINSDENWGDSIQAETTDKEEFFATSGYRTLTRRSFGGEKNGIILHIICSHWRLIKSPSRMWVGYLKENVNIPLGNLVIEVANSHVSNNHYLLKGHQYEYFLINSIHGIAFVIDTKGENISTSTLEKDIDAMSFCFGMPLSLNFFSGLDHKGNITGYQGGDVGFARIKKNSNLSPIPINPTFSWIPILFNKISNTLNKNDKKSGFLYESISFYIESSAELWLSSKEAKLMLACVSAANCHINEGLTLYDYKDFLDISFLKENISLIRQKAYDASAKEQDLIRKDNLICVSSFKDVIELGLSQVNVKDAENLLYTVTESYEHLLGISINDSPDASRSLQKGLQVLCVSFISKFVGYEGPTISLEGDNILFPLAEKNSKFLGESYIASVKNKITVSDPSELWPSFQIPAIPPNSLLEIIENFSKGLSNKTDGIIQARFIPVPSPTDNKINVYDFTIEMLKPPYANNILFSVKNHKDKRPIEIFNWTEGNIAIDKPDKLINFLRKFAESNETKNTIERLLLTSYDK